MSCRAVSQAVNELEWFGGGRRVGGMRSAGGCAWCGRLAASAAPLVRVLRPHPAYDDLHRQVPPQSPTFMRVSTSFVQTLPASVWAGRSNSDPHSRGPCQSLNRVQKLTRNGATTRLGKTRGSCTLGETVNEELDFVRAYSSNNYAR